MKQISGVFKTTLCTPIAELCDLVIVPVVCRNVHLWCCHQLEREGNGCVT